MRGPALLAVLGGCAAAGGDAPDAVVRDVLRSVPLVDGHNDLPWQYLERAQNHLAALDIAQDLRALDPPLHTDVPRLRQGGVGAQFWSVYTSTATAGPGAARAVLEQIDVVHRLCERYPDDFALALTADDVERIHRSGRIAALIGMEGGHCLEDSLAVLRMLYRAGARYLTLTHSKNTGWADACTDTPVHGGLSPFGVEVVREMNRLGMLVDLSHVSPETMHDALDAAEAPPIFSHSGARAVCDHVRNVPDDVLVRLRETDGVVMVTFVPGFVSEEVRRHGAAERAEGRRLQEQFPDDASAVDAGLAAWRAAHPAPQATLAQVADHVDHVVAVAGVDHVGLGSDFDGIDFGPVGLEDVSKYPDLLAELYRRGYAPAELEKIAGGNLLRVLRKVEAAAALARAQRPAADVRFEELQGSAAEPAR